VRTFDPRLVQNIGRTTGHYYFSPDNCAQPTEGQGNNGSLGGNAFRGRVNFDVAFGEIH
jgi:hypothetical protein